MKQLLGSVSLWFLISTKKLEINLELSGFHLGLTLYIKHGKWVFSGVLIYVELWITPHDYNSLEMFDISQFLNISHDIAILNTFGFQWFRR